MSDTQVIKDGGKEEQRRQQLVIGLLQQPTMGKAAKSAGMSAVTAWRMSKTPEFQEEYRQARRKAFEEAMARLLYASNTAVSTLLAVMEDSKSPPAVRVRAAECVLQHGTRSFESEDLATRVDSIEKWMLHAIEHPEMVQQRGLSST
jgi:ABC-type branched-subunit amino acid transport system substrate-binding protein